MRAVTGTKATLTTCDPETNKFVTETDAPQPAEEGQEVVYTYDVLFRVRLADAAGQRFMSSVAWDGALPLP